MVVPLPVSATPMFSQELEAGGALDLVGDGS